MVYYATIYNSNTVLSVASMEKLLCYFCIGVVHYLCLGLLTTLSFLGGSGGSSIRFFGSSNLGFSRISSCVLNFSLTSGWFSENLNNIVIAT